VLGRLGNVCCDEAALLHEAGTLLDVADFLSLAPPVPPAGLATRA
jgi:hypothetical protein